MENHPETHPPVSAPDDKELLDNIDGRMHGPMSVFIEKYFGDFEYVQQDASLEIRAAGRVITRCAVPPTPSADNFLQWFSDNISQERDGARGSWHISPEQESASGSRLLLSMPTSPVNDQTKREHVQVIGQFQHHNSVSYKDGLLRLCRSAYQVFTSQSTRLFLHGFYIRGSQIEFWVFDRCGLYCSDVFNIQGDFIQFLSIILSYQVMTDHDLGNTNIIKTDNGGSYVTLDNASMPSFGKLYLETNPIASREGLVGAGTTCYRARTPDSDHWEYVVKFKWRWARHRPENALLELTRERRVWGIVSLDDYKEVESTANLRRGLRWGEHRKFILRGRDGSIEKRRQGDTRDSGLAEYTEETDEFFRNHIFACVVTSPVGRELHSFQSVLELLRVLRDAIKCHRSLYSDGGILHQDISDGNIIIRSNQGEPKGILIDLDSAIEITEASESEPGTTITGTRPFMAIGVLKSQCHTYRHDLESFLYVFLWTIISNHTQNPPRASKLRGWSNGDWDELAARKSLDMDQDSFHGILAEFTPEFQSLKPLAERLRQILFPLRDGVIWTGTDESPEAVDQLIQLYDGMIRAFEEAIASQGGRSM